MVPGNAVILTKPIGTGVLFAAEMRMAARGEWISEALGSMCLSNREAALLLRSVGAATSCTDVTGFGLLGHLVEMIKVRCGPPSPRRKSHSLCQPQASPDTQVELQLDALPLLPGAVECTKRGIFSSLQPANLRLKRAVLNEAEALEHPAYPLLFDPQTAGGLLATVPLELAEQCVAVLRDKGYRSAAIIGTVSAGSGGVQLQQ